jgi:hypothetical protein
MWFGAAKRWLRRGWLLGAFEFFFSFYGLLLGFSAAELVGGFARLIHQRRNVRFGALTPLLAVFVAIDIATFWNQAWVIFRNAPFNMALLVLGLFVAATFYVAATLVFPRELKTGDTMDDHFWAHRRLVMLCVLAANWTMGGLFFAVTALSGELPNANLPPVFWIGFILFSVFSLIAAFAKGKWIVLGALSILVAYHLYTTARAAHVIIQNGGWPIIGPG